MDIYDFFGSMQEYALDSENYKKWRKIHGNAFGYVFSSAFEDSPELQMHLTAALIKVSKRDYDSGLSMLKQLEDFCLCDFDSFALNYFIGLCFECMENEEQMNIYYEKMCESDLNYSFTMAFHPYYRTAKFAQRKSENEKSLHYYNKALEVYLEQDETDDKKETIGQIYYEMGTVCLSCGALKKSREFLERSCEYSPIENLQRTYVTAILCAAEGNIAESEKLVNSLPDYLKTECQRLIDSILHKS